MFKAMKEQAQAGGSKEIGTHAVFMYRLYPLGLFAYRLRSLGWGNT
jgi:hypothetical protein